MGRFCRVRLVVSLAATGHLQAPRQHGPFNHHGMDFGVGTVAQDLDERSILRNIREDFSPGQLISTAAQPTHSVSELPPNHSLEVLRHRCS
jgi:hypothetical protein